jgi:hypothetical protein
MIPNVSTEAISISKEKDKVLESSNLMMEKSTGLNLIKIKFMESRNR